MKTTARTLLTVLVTGSLLGLFASACGGDPPVDALQAAEDAINQASDVTRNCAPEEFRAAERLFEQAQEANRAGDYDRARLLAESARDQAERARLTAQANADDCEALNPGEDDERNPLGERPTYVDTDYELIPVYFGYDAFNLDERARQTLARHAEYLGQTAYSLVIEGHCDANGTDAYNLALGESRARAVARQLVTLGIPAERLSTISYGEFRPASPHDNALNRRAEFRLRE
ncbi:MAG: OmpA family protein [Myxococcales bacterium]|nr:OmpA family protein [Myxococcales bacterium]